MEDLHIVIEAEPLFEIGPLTVTNSMVGAWVAMAILVALALFAARRPQLIPSRVQSLVELPFEFMVDLTQAQGGSRWRSFLPLVATLFLFILVANWMGLLPGVGTITIDRELHGEIEHVPLIRPANADLNMTLAMAIVTFVAFVGWGVRVQGLGGYLKELTTPLYLAPIHIIGELSRLISLSVRLFGNVFAGEALLVVMLTLPLAVGFLVPAAFFVPTVFYGLEVLFGFVQALIFALLTLAYIALAASEHGHGQSHVTEPSPEAAMLPDQAIGQPAH